ncbi:MAG TPA: hypothetical protein VGX21_02395 [Methylomirabilota bacterium]|jgi:pseudouridine-5'-phosphate glycosidase|nr:hypothetical protein [Methylomirabilota bacterium]
MGTIRVLSPVAESKVSQSAPLALPADLAGKTIGFLDNTKANFALLTKEMEALLRERHGLAGALHRKKANAATPAAPEVLAALAGVDLVVTGSAD